MDSQSQSVRARGGEGGDLLSNSSPSPAAHRAGTSEGEPEMKKSTKKSKRKAAKEEGALRPTDRFDRPMLAVGFSDGIERETEKAVQLHVINCDHNRHGQEATVWMPKSQLARAPAKEYDGMENDERDRIFATGWIVDRIMEEKGLRILAL